MKGGAMKRPSYPTVASTLALVVALSGGAYAFSVPNNSVGTPQLKDGAVTNPKLDSSAVTGPKVKNKSIAALDLGKSAKKVFGLDRNQSPDVSMTPNEATTVTVDCDAGKVAVGGGFYRSAADVEIFWSYATDDNTWSVSGHPGASTGRNMVAHVICVNG
jgi:hypothetical protein